MTLESSDPPEVTAPSEKVAPALEGSTALIEGVNDVVTTRAPEAVLAPRGPELQPRLGRWSQWNHHERPLLSGVWSMGKVSLHTHEGIGSQFYGGQAWVPEEQGNLCSCYQPATFHPPPHAWKTMCCVPKVFIGIRC